MLSLSPQALLPAPLRRRPAKPGLLGVTATCDTVKVEFTPPFGRGEWQGKGPCRQVVSFLWRCTCVNLKRCMHQAR